MGTTCIARQPIVDARKDVRAYELLFREDPDADTSGQRCDEQATASVVLRTLIGIGLDRVTSGRKAFINCNQRVLNIEGLHQILHPDHVVLEVLETVEPHPMLLRRLRALAEHGFKIALDDYAFDPRFEPLLEFADYVKVDVQATGTGDPRQMAMLRRSGRSLLIAEKVETYEEFARCVDVGYDLFQGWFFCRPETLEGQVPDANRLTAIQVIARILDSDAPIDDVVRLVTLDPALSYCVLRVANSGLYARSMEVESVHAGVMRLGLAGLRRWVSIMLMAGMRHKPRELLTTAIVRGRMCEVLAADLGGEADALFTVGLFSVLDAMFDRPLGHILEELPLSNFVTDSLLFGTGIGGEILRSVVAQEQGAWDRAPSQIPRERLASAWLESLDWGETMLRSLGIAAPEAPREVVLARR